jgi:hypothetical protein
MHEAFKMEADQTFDEASDRKEDLETQTKSSTNFADTGAKQRNKRASNSKETEERETDPQIQVKSSYYSPNFIETEPAHITTPRSA